MLGEPQPYGKQQDRNGRAKEYLFYSTWHDSAVLAAFGGPHEGMMALTSRHRDGTFTANVLRGANVSVVRGSTGRSGSSAALRLIQIARGSDIVITPDGPRGPRRRVSRGIVFLASRTGNRIAPSAFSCQDAWEIKGSWTSLLIPKPFSRLALFVGDAISVPPNLDEAGIEAYRQILQQAMDRLQSRADASIAIGEPEDGVLGGERGQPREGACAARQAA